MKRIASLFLGLAVAAAAVCACTATVFAAGPALLKMLRGEISFFAAATAETADPLEAPRGSYAGTQPQLEAYNAPVGQTVESAGISVTLDNVAMDVSGMDAFFTIRGGDTVQALLDAAGMDPTAVDWASLGLDSSFWRTTMNGDEAALEIDQGDYYLNEDGSIRPISKWSGVSFTDQQKADYVAGKAVKLENVTDKQGFHATMYIKFNPEKGRPYRYDTNPDNAQQVAPSNESRTQVAVNNDGKTNEATKNLREPLQKGQTNPKDARQQQQQEKPQKKTGKGMKM